MPRKRSRRGKHQPLGIEILHEDRDIIVVNKAAGLLTIGTGRDGGRTALAALMDYVKKGNPKGRLLTGRKNQIRVHLADKGWPIVGDSKYGRKIRDHKRLALHSHKLGIDQPWNGKRLIFTAPVPESFHRMAAAPPPAPLREKEPK